MNANNHFDFPWLLGPAAEKVFINKHWEKKPLLVSRSSDFYDSFLSVDDVDKIITTSGHKPLSIIKGGNLVPGAYYNFGENKEKILELFNDGGTIILDKLEKTSSNLGKLCAGVRKYFGVTNKVFCNLYFTPPGTQAFDVHADDQDVFVLQIGGTKKWLVYEPEFELPINEEQSQLADGFEERNQPVLDLELRSGDLLYVPKGFPHKVSTTDQHSIHVTMAVVNYTVYDLCAEILKSMSRENVMFRRSLSKNFVEISDADMINQLLLATQESVSQGADKIMSIISNENQPSMEGCFADLLKAGDIHKDTECSVRKDLDVVVDFSKGKTNIRTRVGAFSIDGFKKEVEFMVSNDRFKVSQIPGKLKNDDKIELVRSFLRAGVLTLQ